MRSTLLKAFPALADASTRRYLLGQLCSVLGTWTQGVTLSLALWEATHSALLVGLLNFLLQVPMLVVPVVVGARLRPETVRADTMRILAGSMSIAAGLLVAAATHRLSAMAILSFAALLGVTSSMELPARQLLLTSSLADKALLTNAVAMNTLVFNVGRMSGPALAAALYLWSGAIGGFICSFAGLAVMLVCIRSLAPAAQAPSAVRHRAGLRESLAFVMQDEFGRMFLPTLVILGLFVGSYQTLIPVLAAGGFSDVARYTGIFFACAGLGSMSAAIFLSGRPGSRSSTWLLARTSWVCAGGLVIIASSTHVLVTGVCFWLVGMALSLSTTLINATLQARSPPHLRGAIVGLYAVAFMGTMPFGHLAMGAVASHVGPRWAFACMALLVMAFQCVLLAWRHAAAPSMPQG